MHSLEPSDARADEPAVRAVADFAAAPAAMGAAGADTERILALQRTAGNTAVGRMLARGTLIRRPTRRLARDGPVPAPGEAAAEVAAADAVADTVKDGKVVKKGKAAVAHQDPKYRTLQ